jgi:Ca-activated chloride channel family protein
MMDWTNPHFAEPQWLWLAVLAPALLLLLFWRSARARSLQLEMVASREALSRLTRSHSPARRMVKNVLLVLAVLGVGLAMARPQWGELTEKGQTLGHDIIFVLDCSRSMLATDVSPNRLERARLAILDFMKGGNLGRVGLITFAGQAFIQCPLTFDYGAFQETLNTVDDKSIPVLGTDIGRALDEAFRASEKREGPKIVILITDGEDLEKGAIAKAEQLGKQNLVIFAIGVGTPAGSEVRVLGEQGRFELLRDQSGEVVVSRLDEPTLRKVANATGGAYFGLGSMGEGLMRVQSLLRDRSLKIGLAPAKKLGVERFHFPLAVVVLFLAAESLIGTRHKRRETVE